MGIQSREGGFVPEVKTPDCAGALGPLTAYPNQSPAPKETAPAGAEAVSQVTTNMHGGPVQILEPASPKIVPAPKT
jgi:hypothetical protein